MSDHSAKMPKTTSASIVTTVTMGRLMAKSERNIGSLPSARVSALAPGLAAGARRCAGGGAASGTSTTLAPGVMARAAPISTTVAGGDAGDHLDLLALGVGDAELHRHALDAAVGDAQHRRLPSERSTAAAGTARPLRTAVDDAPLGVEAGDQPAALVGQRDVDLHLPRGRVGHRVDALRRCR